MTQQRQTFKILAVLFTGLLVFGMMTPALAQYQVGQTVTDFTLNDLHGNAVSLSDFDGQLKVLNFFATW